MPGYAIIEAPSVLRLFLRGVEHLPMALLDAGLTDAIGWRHAGRVTPPPYDAELDPATKLLNPTGLRDYAQKLADATGDVLDSGDVPIVLVGDCSILLRTMLALGLGAMAMAALATGSKRSSNRGKTGSRARAAALSARQEA